MRITEKLKRRGIQLEPIGISTNPAKLCRQYKYSSCFYDVSFRALLVRIKERGVAYVKVGHFVDERQLNQSVEYVF